MRKKPTTKRNYKTTVWWVLLFAIILTIILIFTPKGSEEVVPKMLPWNSFYNEQNQLVALGLTLNKSTVNDAVELFGSDYEMLVFSERDASNKVVEVNFPTMNLARLRGFLTLVLEVPELELDEMFSRGVKSTMNHSGKREITLFRGDKLSLMDNKIRYFTFVPRKDLPEDLLKSLFGEPELIKADLHGINRWFYPQKGLEIIVNPHGADVFQYYLVPPLEVLLEKHAYLLDITPS